MFSQWSFLYSRFYVRCDYEMKVEAMMVNNSINVNKTITSDLEITDHNNDQDIYCWKSRYSFVYFSGIVDHHGLHKASEHIIAEYCLILAYYWYLKLHGNLSSFISNIGWMCSFNQISNKVTELCMKTRTQMQRCTMRLRSRENESINLTSGERLRQLRLIVYFLKTRT